LVEAINYEGVEMPPNGKLDPAKVAILTRWVSLGAPLAQSRSRGPCPLRRRDRSTSISIETHRRRPRFWSLQPVRKPTVPDLPKSGSTDWADWDANPIDRFILQALLK